MATKFQIDGILERLKALSDDHIETHPDEINSGHVGTLNHCASLLRQITEAAFREASMPLDPAQRHQIEQDAITAGWEAERVAACDDAIALLREIADLERDDDGDVIIGTDADGHNDLMARIAAFLATNDQ